MGPRCQYQRACAAWDGLSDANEGAERASQRERCRQKTAKKHRRHNSGKVVAGSWHPRIARMVPQTRAAEEQGAACQEIWWTPNRSQTRRSSSPTRVVERMVARSSARSHTRSGLPGMPDTGRTTDGIQMAEEQLGSRSGPTDRLSDPLRSFPGKRISGRVNRTSFPVLGCGQCRAKAHRKTPIARSSASRHVASRFASHRRRHRQPPGFNLAMSASGYSLTMSTLIMLSLRGRQTLGVTTYAVKVKAKDRRFAKNAQNCR